MEEKIEQPKKRSVKKIVFWILGIMLVLMLIPVVVAAWICAALLDPQPLPARDCQPDFSQYESCIKKFQIRQEEGESLEAAMIKDKTVQLTKAEVNAVLDSLTAGARGYLAVRLPDTTICDVRFEKGALYADVSQKAAFSTPFGNFMNMKITIIPRIENQHLFLDVKKLSVGTMQLSGDWVQKYIDKDLKNFEKSDNGQMIVSMLKGLQLGDDYVKVTFNPMQVNMFLMQQALSIFSEGGDSSNMSDLLKMLK